RRRTGRRRPPAPGRPADAPGRPGRLRRLVRRVGRPVGGRRGARRDSRLPHGAVRRGHRQGLPPGLAGPRRSGPRPTASIHPRPARRRRMVTGPEETDMYDSHIGSTLGQGVATLRRDDPELFDLLEREHTRQTETLSLVASSGGTDPSVMAVVGSSIVNVTAEGYPGKRYHAGCQYVDQAEELAVERAKRVFGARYVNVQPHCASFANHTVMQALLKPGDTILGMALDQGGHLTHGSPVNLSGQLFDVRAYGLHEQGLIDYAQLRELGQVPRPQPLACGTAAAPPASPVNRSRKPSDVAAYARDEKGLSDYAQLRHLALVHRPKLIACGTTPYPRVVDFDRIPAIADEVGASVLADITHIAGLVAAGLHPSPIDAAHFTTTCTFKQLYGPRGGLIMMGRDADHIPEGSNRSLSQLIQSAVFPLMQGSPEVHTIAAKARAMGRLLQPEF